MLRIPRRREPAASAEVTPVKITAADIPAFGRISSTRDVERIQLSEGLCFVFLVISWVRNDNKVDNVVPILVSKVDWQGCSKVDR